MTTTDSVSCGICGNPGAHHAPGEPPRCGGDGRCETARELAADHSGLLARIDDGDERAARLAILAGDRYPGEYDTPDVADWLAVQENSRDAGVYWLTTADSLARALADVVDDPGDWTPALIVNLTTGETWRVEITATLGPRVSAR